ncbi:SdrD B-like domain-containing protein [Saccharothrix coeruleofusca]|uniref:SdrD B-like domain-containing protein n=1 Tax=Saccharothrix coeruleofusca TaxID=33919 RepID=UPI0016717536|nr:SdrD B-like domain-containing protein [Saccharothrix coeruleofusca]MBP2335909.1 hypothetical protein [Saccharothrix coeruleofusca]
MVRRASAAVLAAGLVLAGTAPAHAGTGELLGAVWFDHVDDGGREAWEPVRAGAPVTVVHLTTGQTRRITTDERGEFHLTGLPFGEYELSVDARGYRPTTATTVRTAVDEASPVSKAGHFGMLGSAVTGFVWDDADRDGRRAEAEAGIATAVALIGRGDSGERVDRTATSQSDNPGGYYGFSDLPAGTYRVVPTVPEGYSPTAIGGGLFSDDSHATGVPASTPPFRVEAANHDNWHIDLGLAPGAGTDPMLVNRQSFKCLDQAYPGGVATTAVNAHDCNNGDNQRWSPRWVGVDTAVVVDRMSGWCLDQEYPHGSATTGVGAYPCNGGANQRWRIDYRPRDNYATLVNEASGWCLDQEYPNGSMSYEVGAWPCNGGQNQTWYWKSWR